jgi:peptidoglycan/xylan/chitin deacetylase (PgdA/CDA1 family)
MASHFPLVFSNDDVGLIEDDIHLQWFDNVIELLEKWKIKGTFFWVPKNNDGTINSNNKRWIKSLKTIIDKGHDVQLHGLTHDCLGFGLPQSGFKNENKTAFAEYESNPEKYQLEWMIPKLKRKLEEGIDIYKKAFGEYPMIFRSPCIGSSDAMYEALKEVGIYASSSRIVNPDSWAYTVNYENKFRNWYSEFSPYPYTVFGVREYPSMSDYSHFGITDNHYDDLLDLIKRDYDCLLNQGKELGVLMCHYHSMNKTWQNTKKFYNSFFEYLLKKYSIQFITFKEFISNKGKK